MDCPPVGAGATIDPDTFDIPATDAATVPIQDAMAHLRCLTQTEAPENFIKRAEVAPVFASLEEPEDLEILAAVDPFAKLLGWIPPDASLKDTLDMLSVDLVLGFYVTDENVLYVVTDTDELTPLAQATVAHEWVHALQQKSFDIDKMGDDVGDFDFDAAGALSALVEGDATYFEEEFTAEYFSRSKRARAIDEELSMATLSAAELFELEALLVDQLMPYLYGPDFVESFLADGGEPPLADLYADPPTTSAEILHPALYAAGFEPSDVAMPDVAAALGGAWAETMDGTWGEFSTANMIAALGGVRAESELTLVDGWRGDKLTGWQSGPGLTVAIASAWSDERKANDVRRRLQSVLDASDVGTAQGDFVEVAPNRYFRVTATCSETLVLMTSDPAAATALGPVEAAGSTCDTSGGGSGGPKI